MIKNNLTKLLLAGATIFSFAFSNSYQSDLNAGAGDLQISYTLKTSTEIIPASGEFKDMCNGDIQMLQKLPTIYDVQKSINEKGDPCIIVEKSKNYQFNDGGKRSKPGGDNGNESFISKTEYCNGQMTYTTPSGTKTSQADLSNEFWLIVKEGFNESTTSGNTLQDMLDYMETNGSTIVHIGNKVTVTTQDASGQSVQSTFSKVTNMLIETKIFSTNGVEKKSFQYTYGCDANGNIFPRTVLSTSQENSPICNTAFVKEVSYIYENYTISQ